MSSIRFSAFLPILLTLVAFGHSPLTAVAQPVFTGNATFVTQAQLNAWDPAFTSVTGTISIQGPDITNLGPLHNIVSTNGIAIITNPTLPSLNGLNALQSIGSVGLDVSNCPLLTNLNGLGALTQVAGTLRISSNNALANLNGLNALQTVGKNLALTSNPALTSLGSLSSLTQVGTSLICQNNDALANLAGLNNLLTAGNIFISGHASLSSITALSSIHTVSFLFVQFNAVLPNLDGLGGLTSATSIQITENDLLANLNGLSNLTFAGTIDVQGNPLLTNLDAFSGLAALAAVDLGDGEISGNLTVLNNAQLSDCCGIYALLNTPGAVPGLTDIQNNQTGCDSPGDVLESCDPCASFPIEPSCQSITASLGANGSVTVPAADLNNGSSGCGALEFTVNGQPSITFDCSSIGANTVILTITDASGASGTCAVVVTVADNLPPTITCPADQTVAANATCDGTVGDHAWQASLADNCSTSNITVTQSPAANTPLHGHNDFETVTLTANVGGNPAGSCTFKVTLKDVTPPSITCTSNIVRNTDLNLCSAAVAYAAPTFSDNCTGASAALFSGGASGSAFPKGANSVVWQATDGAGFTKRCTFTITVNDAQLPTITCPANQTKSTDAGFCTAVTSYTAPTMADNCPGGSTALVSGLASGLPFPKGITIVQWKATDGAGLTKTCTFRVTVNDTQAPTISCPSSQSLNTDANLCTAVATYATPTAADNCTPPPTVVKVSGLASGSNFPKGANLVVWKATDGAGLTQTCSFTVTVADAQLPSISCPANIAVTAPSGQCSTVVIYANATATDNCAVQSTFLLSGLASGSVFPHGVTANVWRAIDNNGGSATCAFTVTVACGTGSTLAPNPATTEVQILTAAGDLTTFKKLSNLDLRLAPNPAMTEVQVLTENLGEKGGDLTVLDAQGRVVWQHRFASETLTSGAVTLDVSREKFAAGVYFVTLRAEGVVTTKRLVVNRL